MSIGDADWLALTQEPTLEPELPICDAHHHLWEFRPEPVPYQRYLLAELAKDLGSGHNVRSTVFIEVKARYRPDGPQEMRPVGEVDFVEGLANESASGRYGRARVAAAIIGYADLKLGERVTPVLDAMQAASPTRFRGVRHSAGWDASPDLVKREIQGVLSSEQYRAGARVLARRGLCLENSLYHPQLEELAAFARAVPDLTIVLNHIGGLARIGAYAKRDDEVLPAWKRGIAAVAACPNVILKLGGVGQRRFGFDWHTRAKPIAGKVFTTRDARFVFGQPAPIPVLMGTSGGPEMLRISGEVAHGIIIPAGNRSFYEYAITTFRRAHTAAGRTDTIRIVLNGNIAVADTSAAAHEVIRPLVADSIAHRAVNPHSLRQLGVTVEQAEAWRANPTSIPDDVLRESAIAGTAEECVEGLARFASWGISQIAMRFPEEETVRAVGTKLLPKLRR